MHVIYALAVLVCDEHRGVLVPREGCSRLSAGVLPSIVASRLPAGERHGEHREQDDVLTLLVHLGYLTYDAVSRTCRVPNDEVRRELARAVGRTRH